MTINILRYFYFTEKAIAIQDGGNTFFSTHKC